MYCLDNTV